MDEKKTELKSEIRRDSNINGILLLIFWVFYVLTYAISKFKTYKAALAQKIVKANEELAKIEYKYKTN